ncbi:MAG: PAS domain S-box protein, partial [Chloroflexi bacterium]|nr:PAS domain S-box protein [Chloroflexota bacterium]
EIIWGRTCASLYQDSREYYQSILPEDQPIMIDALEKQAQGQRTEIEYRIQKPDGSVRWVWDRSFPIFDKKGILTTNAGVATDITEIKTTQRELEALNSELEERVEERTAQVRQSETTYRALFENSNDGIFLISPEGVELQANHQALDILGYTQEEWNTINNNQLVPFDQQQNADENFQAAVRGEYVPLYERTLLTKDGKKIETEINLSAVRDASGKAILVQGVVRDITERKKAEEALRSNRDKLSAANAALEKASRLKDEFLASMSHELRTPLTGVLGLAEVLQLQTHGSLNEKQLRALKGIENSGRHLLELINDILDLSKIEAGKLDMRLEACSVADQCRASLQLVKGMANQKNQKIDFQMQPASITLRADARRLKQMLVNLLSNAIKFTPEGGELGLDVNLNEDEKTVIFSVWDEGIGIQPQELGTLFRPFVQLDSSLARQYTGTGLGLSLVKRMAELLGGSVRVESTPKLGSRFTIILPWSEDVTQPVPDLSEDSPDLLTWARNTAPLILMADDNEISLEIITGLLESTGCRVIRSHIDPAIASIPIIAVTALVMPGDRERCMAAGADEYVSKPIVFSKLIKLINRLLEQKKKS